MQLFEDSWLRAWRALGFSGSTDLREQLLTAYREPHRHYHTLQHLGECLQHFERAQAWARHPGEVELALWFHDAVYELKSSDNERRSADWALSALVAAGAASEVRARVERLIMATCHTAIPTEADEQLLVDIDLSILGAEPARFAEYDRQVRAEYSWVPSLIYKFKRKDVLRSFLERPALYSTAYFQERLAQQAIENLQRAVA